jgi:hypothetical protein
MDPKLAVDASDVGVNPVGAGVEIGGDLLVGVFVAPSPVPP